LLSSFFGQQDLQRFPLDRIGFCSELIGVVRDILALDKFFPW